jgi:hypothetical protein
MKELEEKLRYMAGKPVRERLKRDFKDDEGWCCSPECC